MMYDKGDRHSWWPWDRYDAAIAILGAIIIGTFAWVLS